MPESSGPPTSLDVTVDGVTRTQSVIGLSTSFETTTLPMPAVAEADDAEEPAQLTARRKSA